MLIVNVIELTCRLYCNVWSINQQENTKIDAISDHNKRIQRLMLSQITTREYKDWCYLRSQQENTKIDAISLILAFMELLLV